MKIISRGISCSDDVAPLRLDRSRVSDAQECRLENEQLKQRLEEKSKQLAFANKEFEAFSYSVSHDLRAPLRHIAAFTELLVAEFEKGDVAKAADYLNRILETTGEMGQLIESLLTFSR